MDPTEIKLNYMKYDPTNPMRCSSPLPPPHHARSRAGLSPRLAVRTVRLRGHPAGEHQRGVLSSRGVPDAYSDSFAIAMFSCSGTTKASSGSPSDQCRHLVATNELEKQFFGRRDRLGVVCNIGAMLHSSAFDDPAFLIETIMRLPFNLQSYGLQFLTHVTEHTALIPHAEQLTITASINAMLEALDAATTASSDEPDAPPSILGRRISTGLVGRPTIQIPAEELAVLATGRVTLPRLAELYRQQKTETMSVENVGATKRTEQGQGNF
ncbi:hypothetical protein BJ138DRAFT_1131488 [Hygrophoropsis aurantiaca]|uniref:Uncharacterized protein n=1 Tax=Hygrophoropsis aurantiaca TaxID=72124 RepID=A0ACB7ZQF2_9AGAM|nr:hypothetical protein BJ138DRAFT_1131488 [Hygrophoropsis aurantiaca]